MQHPIDVSQCPSSLLRCGQKYLLLKTVDQGDLRSKAVEVRDAARGVLTDPEFSLVLNGQRTFKQDELELTKSDDGFLVVRRCVGSYDQVGNCAGVCLIAECDAPPVYKIACSTHIGDAGLDSSESAWTSPENAGASDDNSPMYLGFNRSDDDVVDGTILNAQDEGNADKETASSSRTTLAEALKKRLSLESSGRTHKRKLSSSETSNDFAVKPGKRNQIKPKAKSLGSKLSLKYREMNRKRKLGSSKDSEQGEPLPKRARKSSNKHRRRNKDVGLPSSDDSPLAMRNSPLVGLQSSNDAASGNSNSGTLASEVTVSSILGSDPSDLSSFK